MKVACLGVITWGFELLEGNVNTKVNNLENKVIKMH